MDECQILQRDWFSVKWLPLFILLLAGCTTAPPTTDGIEEEVRTSQSFNLYNCDMILALALREYSAVETLLPPGYWPEDAAEFLDLDVATGQGMTALLVGDCESFEEKSPVSIATGWILVKDPSLPDGPTGEALNFYQLFGASSSMEAQEYLAQIGYEAEVSNITFGSSTVLPQGVRGDVMNESIGFWLEAAQTGQQVPNDDSRTFRLWQRNGDGTQLMEVNEEAPGELSVGHCSTTPGGLADSLFGDACATLQSPVSQDATALVYFPLFGYDFLSTVTVFDATPV